LSIIERINNMPIKIPNKLPAAKILEEENIFVDRDCIIYCRVSSPNKKEDLNRQIERCKEFAIKN
jgi:predicted site-specific integrase-resolvase